jgi:hypothetical protein
MSYKDWLTSCAICTRAVNLTESKANEYGQAVHEDCSVSKLVLKSYARAGYNRPSHVQSRKRRPIPALGSDDVYRGTPIPHPSLGGFWY